MRASRREFLLIGLTWCGALGCETERKRSEYDLLKDFWDTPGRGRDAEIEAQSAYKKKHGEYPDEGNESVTRLLEDRDRRRHH